MIAKEFNFRFDELAIDPMQIQAVLGFPDSPLPDPFNFYLEEALDFASQMTEILAVCRIVDGIALDPLKGSLSAGGTSFHIGKTLCKELRGAEKILFFVCTAGKSISEKSSSLLKGDDPAKGYIYDQVGSFLADAAAEKMQLLVQEELQQKGEKITNRYSPGYCQWEVTEQHKLFSLFHGDPCGVTLTASALMYPIKSISGMIGIGKTVSFRNYPCELCQIKDCFYRKVQMQNPSGQ
ncbi:MAG: vitamin B12 dependent-methionine synthase activation domain-containing protein [Prolixibacteraceae bacterium]